MGGSANSLDFVSHLLGTRKREEPRFSRSVRSGDSQQATSGRGTPLLGPKKLTARTHALLSRATEEDGGLGSQRQQWPRGHPMLRAAEHAHLVPGRLFVNAALRSLTSASARGLCSSWPGHCLPSVQQDRRAQQRPARGAPGDPRTSCRLHFHNDSVTGGLRACC